MRYSNLSNNMMISKLSEQQLQFKYSSWWAGGALEIIVKKSSWMTSPLLGRLILWSHYKIGISISIRQIVASIIGYYFIYACIWDFTLILITLVKTSIIKCYSETVLICRLCMDQFLRLPSPPPGQYPRDLYFFCKNVVNSPPPGL
jgi:hypothetical protein